MYYKTFLYVSMIIGIISQVYCAGNNDTEQIHSNSSQLLLNGKLIFTHVIFRHGDRMPMYLCPTDQWNDLKYWPNYWGDLSKIGMQQQYELGKWLRKRYDNLLNRTYSPLEIYVRSTDEDRCITSALANLAGLYKPQGDNIWNPDIIWQPIPVHSFPKGADSTMGRGTCPEYMKYFDDALKLPEVQNVLNQSQYYMKYFTEHCGSPSNTIDDLYYLLDKFRIEELYNRTIPEWANKIYKSEEFIRIALFSFHLKTFTRELARLKGGPLLKEILDRMVIKAKGKLNPDRSVWMYSGHDLTIAAILDALNMFEIHNPKYAATLMFELRLDNASNPFVSIFYKNSTTIDEPYLLNIPGCGTICPLEEMFTLFKSVIPIDIAYECDPSKDLTGSSQMLVTLSIFFVMLIIMFALTCGAICRLKHHNIQQSNS